MVVMSRRTTVLVPMLHGPFYGEPRYSANRQPGASLPTPGMVAVHSHLAIAVALG